MDEDVLVVLALIGVSIGFASIVLVVLLLFGSPNNTKRQPNEKVACLIIAGSGGHTTEILRLMSGLKMNYSPRHYVIANTDEMSVEKVQAFQKTQDPSIEYHIHKIPRSREVNQSWLSTVLSTLIAAVHSVPLVFRLKPDLVLSNGPGTCVPLVITAAFIRMVHLRPIRIIYVESICRVLTLSLSAKLVYFFCDHLLVQWPQLQKRYPRTQYIGRLV